MSGADLYLVVGLVVAALGMHRFTMTRDLVRRVVALNVTGTGILLLLVAVARRGGPGSPDPVPHALVLTGIVVAVSMTAVALSLVRRVEAFEASEAEAEEPDGAEGS